MHLITMAHHGEAQGVIEKFQLKKHSADTFLGENLVLLITGEGPFEAATRTALEISKHQVSRILNIGIAGTLTDKYRIGDLIEVRSVYLIQELKPFFKTFQLSTTGVDCLTSFERILDTEKAGVLKGLGTVVDRELWGVAMAAKTAGVPLQSFKIISDEAGSLKACELVREMTDEFSEKIATAVSKIIGKEEETYCLKGFHFTFSLKHKFESLIQKLSIKEEKTREEILHSLPLDVFLTLEITPKERAKKLIEHLEDQIDPVKKVISETTEALTKTFSSQGFRLHLDPALENPKAVISFEAGDDRELQDKVIKLSSLSLASLEKMMKGEFHVE